MPILHVQSNFNPQLDSTGPFHGASAQFLNPTIEENTLVAAVVSTGSANAGVVSDDGGNTWVTGATGILRDSVEALDLYDINIYYVKDAKPNAGWVSVPGIFTHPGWGALFIHEYSGVDTVSPLTTTVAKSSNTSPWLGPGAQFPAVFSKFTVANASGGNTVYTSTLTAGIPGSTNAWVGYTFLASGFTNGGNNGTFTCVASGPTTITLNNPSGVTEVATTANCLQVPTTLTKQPTGPELVYCVADINTVAAGFTSLNGASTVFMTQAPDPTVLDVVQTRESHILTCTNDPIVFSYTNAMAALFLKPYPPPCLIQFGVGI